jgi:hypothetical protein
MKLYPDASATIRIAVALCKYAMRVNSICANIRIHIRIASEQRDPVLMQHRMRIFVRRCCRIGVILIKPAPLGPAPTADRSNRYLGRACARTRPGHGMCRPDLLGIASVARRDKVELAPAIAVRLGGPIRRPSRDNRGDRATASDTRAAAADISHAPETPPRTGSGRTQPGGRSISALPKSRSRGAHRRHRCSRLGWFGQTGRAQCTADRPEAPRTGAGIDLGAATDISPIYCTSMLLAVNVATSIYVCTANMTCGIMSVASCVRTDSALPLHRNISPPDCEIIASNTSCIE